MSLHPWFAETGPLARVLPGFRHRSEQLAMAEAVLQAIREQQTVVLEAGTGVGKTAAYLVPALLEGGKVIVSTGTKALQDQLRDKDVPAIQKAMALPLRVAVLKGRSNYLCWHLLDRANRDATLLASRQEVRDLSEINRHAPMSLTGDIAECASVPEHASIWARVTSTRDNCLGSECPRYADCFVVKARKQALDADLVIVNHHLFFADWVLREEGVPQLLPHAQTVIFDEAHQLPSTASLFFGESLSSAQLLEWVRDMLAVGVTQARDACDWSSRLAPLERATRDLRLSFASQTQRQSRDELAATHAVFGVLQRLDDALLDVREVLEPQAQRGPELQQLLRRCEDLHRRLITWQPGAGAQACDDAQHLCWIDVGTHGVQLHRTPLDVAELFRRQRLGKVQSASPQISEAQVADLPASREGPHTSPLADEDVSQEHSDKGGEDAAATKKAWIFASATLAVKGDFKHFTQTLGLEDAQCMAWASPYDFPNQAMLYVPSDLPMPNQEAHTDAVVDAALPLIQVNRGRAFFLCTSLRAVERAAMRLREKLQALDEPLPVMQQGQAPRSTLLDDYRRAGNAVLVGSHSFWEGIDVKGDLLSLVIIDKLPFAPPDDPVTAKRLAMLEAHGGQAFMSHQVPQAIMALKQGAGRLIRSEADHGVLLIGDRRLVERPYGRRIWQSLPPMRRTRDAQQALDFLRHIATLGSGDAHADPCLADGPLTAPPTPG